jgi:hypothetical protein
VTPFAPQRAPKKRHTHGVRAVVALLLCVAILIPACSGIKTYDDSLNKNLHVRTATDSGSWFSRIRAAVDIHRVGEQCTIDYEGTVQLTEPTIEIGIPPDRWSHLVFVFASSSFLANRSGTITYETMVKPRANHRYDVEVSYRNDMYHVAIRETPPNRSISRELDRVQLRACHSPTAKK